MYNSLKNNFLRAFYLSIFSTFLVSIVFIIGSKESFENIFLLVGFSSVCIFFSIAILKSILYIFKNYRKNSYLKSKEKCVQEKKAKREEWINNRKEEEKINKENKIKKNEIQLTKIFSGLNKKELAELKHHISLRKLSVHNIEEIDYLAFLIKNDMRINDKN